MDLSNFDKLPQEKRANQNAGENKCDNGTFEYEQAKRGSNSQTYLLRRLARDKPEILDAYEQGEYPSVRQAAIGKVKKSSLTMYNLKKPIRAHHNC